MAIKYPLTCDTPSKRTEFLYRMQELLRLEHNLISDWHFRELSLESYNTLPSALKDKYVYTLLEKLSKEDFQKYHIDDFAPVSNEISTAIGEQRKLLKQLTTWDNDINIRDS